MIFYLNLFKAIEFALEEIDINRPAPNLQLGLGNEIDSFPSAVIAEKLKQSIAKNEQLNLLFDFLALFVPGEEKKYC